mmetsp:Transcript_27749/g.70036  ORF Transcript_27749/g.70036 Transcript_27749/m.70036 type:complete len:201 (+) Transcript_27749:191-793(+)
MRSSMTTDIEHPGAEAGVRFRQRTIPAREQLRRAWAAVRENNQWRIPASAVFPMATKMALARTRVSRTGMREPPSAPSPRRARIQKTPILTSPTTSSTSPPRTTVSIKRPRPAGAGGPRARWDRVATRTPGRKMAQRKSRGDPTSRCAAPAIRTVRTARQRSRAIAVLVLKRSRLAVPAVGTQAKTWGPRGTRRTRTPAT